jgi:hypothetical protein
MIMMERRDRQGAGSGDIAGRRPILLPLPSFPQGGHAASGSMSPQAQKSTNLEFAVTGTNNPLFAVKGRSATNCRRVPDGLVFSAIRRAPGRRRVLMLFWLSPGRSLTSESARGRGFPGTPGTRTLGRFALGRRGRRATAQRNWANGPPRRTTFLARSHRCFVREVFLARE